MSNHTDSDTRSRKALTRPFFGERGRTRRSSDVPRMIVAHRFGEDRLTLLDVYPSESVSKLPPHVIDQWRTDWRTWIRESSDIWGSHCSRRFPHTYKDDKVPLPPDNELEEFDKYWIDVSEKEVDLGRYGMQESSGNWRYYRPIFEPLPGQMGDHYAQALKTEQERLDHERICCVGCIVRDELNTKKEDHTSTLVTFIPDGQSISPVTLSTVKTEVEEHEKEWNDIYQASGWEAARDAIESWTRSRQSLGGSAYLLEPKSTPCLWELCSRRARAREACESGHGPRVTYQSADQELSSGRKGGR